MDQKKASKIFWDIYTAYPEYEDKLLEIEELLQQGEKDRAELEELRTYKQMWNKVDNELINHLDEPITFIDGIKEKYIGKRTEKKDMGSIRNEKQAIEALKKLMYKTEDDIKERNIPEYQHKFNDWLRGLIKEFEEGKMKWMG